MIKRLIFAWRLKYAKAEADRLHKETRRKYMVIIHNGQPKAVSKKQIRFLITTHRFKKGVTIQDIEKTSLYTTL